MRRNKVYIFCPGNLTTGGAEALHQLCHVLNSNGVEARMTYVLKNKIAGWLPIPLKYLDYNIRVASNAVFNSNTDVVIPESMCEWLPTVRFCRVYLWWLSVAYNNLDQRNQFPKNLMHLYQSYYAKEYLDSQKLTPNLPLSDYINIDKVKLNIAKRGMAISLRKHSKSYRKISKEIIEKYGPEIVENQHYKEVLKTLNRVKVLVDFGYFPGKDRLPREARMLGCEVILSKEGAAKNRFDFQEKDYLKVDNYISFNQLIEHIDLLLDKTTSIPDVNRDMSGKKLFIEQCFTVFGLSKEKKLSCNQLLAFNSDILRSRLYWSVWKLKFSLKSFLSNGSFIKYKE